MRVVLLFLVLAAAGGKADTEIHRCLLEDGTFSFQETPCAEPTAKNDDGDNSGRSPESPETPAAAEDVFDFVNPFDEPADSSTPVEPALPERLSADRAACEKETRDAIDVIDLEMQATSYSKEQGRQYLAELLELTRQLRACKQL